MSEPLVPPYRQRVAIVGSRDYADLEDVRRYVRHLPAGTIVISGGARGVDRCAESEAKRRGLEVCSYPVPAEAWRTLGRRAGHARNEQVVAACDSLVCFWNGTSKGSYDAVRLARAAGKVVTLFVNGTRVPDAPAPRRATATRTPRPIAAEQLSLDV